MNYSFRDPALLEEALNHSSYANEHRARQMNSNERLEFLGDSVLGFVTAEFLFLQHPDLPEGDLTRIRAALVCEQSLYEVARKLELGRYLKLGKGEEAGGGRERTSILADATEAVFAAVYLDGGITAASALIHRCLLDAEREEAVEERRRDFKTELQELVQRKADQVLLYRMLQRRLKLGYSRAARLVDQMEQRAIVGPFEGSKPRQLLITKEKWQELQMGGSGAAVPTPDEPPFDEELPEEEE